MMSSQREKREFKQRELEQELGQEEVGHAQGRWVKASGPEDIGGFEFQVKHPTGWKTVGFVKTEDKPKKYQAGNIKLYNGATGKDVTVNLGDYYIQES